MSDTTFYVCYCDLTGECHALARRADHCELCRGPQVATAERVERMFKGYQTRYEDLEVLHHSTSEARDLAEAKLAATGLRGNIPRRT